MEDNLTRLIKLISLELEIDIEKIKLETDFEEDLGADSLDIVELVTTIEREFNIEVDEDKASQVASVQDALDYIEGR